MIIDDKIRNKKIQYNINRVAAKISALSSDKIDKYEFLTGKEILPSDQSRIIEQVKFTYSPFSKAFEKQINKIEDQWKKTWSFKTLKSYENKQDIKSTDGIFPKEMRTNEIKNKIYEIKKWKEKITQKDLKYETKKYT